MNDPSLIKEIIETYTISNNKLTSLSITIIIFTSANIIAIIANIWSSFRLKNKEKGIIKYEKLEESRIRIHHELFLKLEELTYYSPTDNSDDFTIKSNEINTFLSKNRLFINKDIYKITDEFNNYFLTVIQDYRKKNTEKEIKILDKYIKLFND